MKITLLKKGYGDLRALKHDLAESLQLNEDEVVVNSTTKHIMIKVSLAKSIDRENT